MTPQARTLDPGTLEAFGLTMENEPFAAELPANARRKILLPRRPGESKFAPPQYYYPASPSGVMPSL